MLRIPMLLPSLAAVALGQAAFAQTTEDVRSDVLSALSTPLPITIVGPLLTRDVTVTEEGEGFRAVLEDTSLMGLFPFGEVSMVLTPLDGDRYRVSEMTFPTEIDIPGLAGLSFSEMEIAGTWSATDRSYSDLTWVTSGLTVSPPDGVPGSIGIGQLSFDVVKEPDDTDTESRFEIGLTDLSVLDLGPENIEAGEVRLFLAANGERPVDLYSLLREVIVRGTMGGQGGDLMELGQSLLGNSYSVVTLDLTARDLDVRERFEADGAYLTAGGATARVELNDVEPRDWGGAEVRIALQDVEQRDYWPEAPVLTLGEAVLAVRGAELPVADMLTTAMLFADPPRGRPVPASALLDGLMEFGALEVRTEGSEVLLEAFERRFVDGEMELQPLFVGGYDDWSMRVALSGLNENQGRVETAFAASGGTFKPREAMGPEAAPHIEAWFPVELQLQSAVSSLNEGLLKRLLADVEIANLNEPVELVLPMLIYGAATVMDVAAGENHYETGLFRVTQSGTLQFYPTEMLSLSPYTGETAVSMAGMDALMDYFETADLGMRPDELSAVRSVFTVLGNLAVDGPDGALDWTISRSDIYRREIIVNDVTLRYPDLVQLLPMFAFAGMSDF